MEDTETPGFGARRSGQARDGRHPTSKRELQDLDLKDLACYQKYFPEQLLNQHSARLGTLKRLVDLLHS